MRNDRTSPARSPSLRLAGLAAALLLACAGPLHAQPARRPPDLERIVARGSGGQLSRASWKVPSDAYLRERKAMLAELRAARGRWARRRPPAYAFRFLAGCMYMPFCDAPGRKVVVPVDPPRGASGEGAPRSMEEVFALLEEALRSDDVRVGHVRFHPRLGYPLRWDQDTALPFSHGHAVRRVRDFRAVPPPGAKGRMKRGAAAEIGRESPDGSR